MFYPNELKKKTMWNLDHNIYKPLDFSETHLCAHKTCTYLHSLTTSTRQYLWTILKMYEPVGYCLMHTPCPWQHPKCIEKIVIQLHMSTIDKWLCENKIFCTKLWKPYLYHCSIAPVITIPPGTWHDILPITFCSSPESGWNDDSYSFLAKISWSLVVPGGTSPVLQIKKKN